MSHRTICHWCWIGQKKSEFDWQGPRVSLSFFSTFQMLKKKSWVHPQDGLSAGETCTRGVWGVYGFSVCRNFASKRPHLLDCFKLPSGFDSSLSREPCVSRPHQSEALLGLMINCICSWSFRGKNLNDKRKVSPKVKVENWNRHVVIPTLRNQKT